MDQPPPADLLESSHTFPGVYQIKAIGLADDGFETRVLDAVREVLHGPAGIEHSVRATPGGRHVSLTLEIPVRDAEQVRAIYAHVRGVKGLTLLL